MAFRTALALAAALALAGAAQAQQGRNFDVPVMNYDLWCQETMRFSFERCGKGEPADVEAFEEVPHLQQRNRDARIEADILRNDPIDRSQTGTLQVQQTRGLNPALPGNVP